VSTVIPARTQNGDSRFNIPGGSTYVREKHDEAREAYNAWTYAGKPRHSYVFECMKRSRAVF